MTQNLLPFTNFVKPGFAKIAPWCLASRDSFLSKEPGRWSAGLRHQRFLLIPANVIGNLVTE
jgi:hypothetical protein